jgi:hypothetical protein
MTDDLSHNDLDDELDAPPRRKASPLSMLTVVLGLGLVGFLLWDMSGDIAFWAKPPKLVELGVPGSYRIEQAADGALARISGNPGGSADRFRQLGKRYEIVAIRGTSILVRREMRGPDLPLPPGRPEPPPNPSPFQAEGRLVLDSSIPAYSHAFNLLVERGDAVPHNGHLYVLLDGEKPRTGWRVPAILGGLLLLACANLWTLARYLRR